MGLRVHKPRTRASLTWFLASRVTTGERRSRAAKEPATSGQATQRAPAAGPGQQHPQAPGQILTSGQRRAEVCAQGAAPKGSKEHPLGPVTPGPKSQRPSRLTSGTASTCPVLPTQPHVWRHGFPRMPTRTWGPGIPRTMVRELRDTGLSGGSKGDAPASQATWRGATAWQRSRDRAHRSLYTRLHVPRGRHAVTLEKGPAPGDIYSTSAQSKHSLPPALSCPAPRTRTGPSLSFQLCVVPAGNHGSPEQPWLEPGGRPQR